jgi:hypothetical protein
MGWRGCCFDLQFKKKRRKKKKGRIGLKLVTTLLNLLTEFAMKNIVGQ